MLRSKASRPLSYGRMKSLVKKAGKMAVIPAFSEEIRLKQQEEKRKLLGIYT